METFLADNAILMVSDLVWLTENPKPEAQEFWQSEYPDIQSIPSRIKLFKKLGYEVMEHFSLGIDAWQNYWLPLQNRVQELKLRLTNSQALSDIEKEIAIYERSAAKDFTYQYFVLKLNH